MNIVFSGTGLYLPKDTISNDELVKSFNAYVDSFNEDNAKAIDDGSLEPLAHSSSAFIEKASGINSRHVIDKRGILDIDLMRPQIDEYLADGQSVQAHMAINAAKDALEAANKSSRDIDWVIATSSGFQRHYPAIAIEVQEALGIDGLGFDMNVACSSVSFALLNAINAIKANAARAVLIVNPELFTLQTNFRCRKSHFLFGDAATAIIVEKANETCYPHAFEVIDCQMKTQFSKNIINDFGFTNDTIEGKDRNYFNQNGNKVFKEVVKLSSDMIVQQLNRHSANIPKRFWLHQANSNMTRLIVNKLIGRNPTIEEAPQPIQFCGNTSSSGAMISYHLHHQDMDTSDYGLFATFGAGYSLGSIILRKC
jgi:beta-ketodecanoyl-[acyl-carrier-protein] synthase